MLRPGVTSSDPAGEQRPSCCRGLQRQLRGSRRPDAERPGREAGLEAALSVGQNKEAEAVSGRAWAGGAVVLTGWVGSLRPVTRHVA